MGTFDPIAPPVVVKVKGWQRAMYVAIIAALASLPILAIATTVSSLNARHSADNTEAALEVARAIEASAECRFDENAEISDINDQIDLWTAVGLAASVREDEARVNEALTNIDALTEDFREAILTRSSIAERCSVAADQHASEGE
jgi:hypothetical protein